MTRTHTYTGTIRDNDKTIMRRYSQTITFIRRRYYKTIIHVTVLTCEITGGTALFWKWNRT
jgi:hypothetical protein